MTNLEDPLTFVRSIKGAPASVIWALLFARRAMTAEELELWTGYTDDTIRKALRLLFNQGWLTAPSARGPWSLAQNPQLPQMDDQPPYPEILGVPSSSSSSSLINDPEDMEEQEQERPPNFSESLKALASAGVREPKASRLAALPHVTPEFIRAHIQQAREQKHSVGTAIYRIEKGWEVALPETEEDWEERDERKRRRYVEGKYADIIQH